MGAMGRMVMSSGLDHELNGVDESEGTQKHAMWNRKVFFPRGGKLYRGRFDGDDHEMIREDREFWNHVAGITGRISTRAVNKESAIVTTASI